MLFSDVHLYVSKSVLLATSKNDWEGALAVVEQGLVYDPKNEEGLVQKAKMIAETQQWQKCYDFIKEAMLEYPNNDTLIGLKETVLDQLPPEVRQRDAPQTFVVNENDLDQAK